MHAETEEFVPPTRLWKRLPPERRLDAARAFWESDDENSQTEQVEAIVALSRHMKFRPQSMQAMPIEKRAKYLTQLPGISESIAARALVAYHLAHQRPMMGAFLDSMAIAHDEGLITEETLDPPDRARLAPAVSALAKAFAADDVAIYLNTLLAQDPQTWGGLSGLPELS